MTIKRTKHPVGPFDRTTTQWTLVDDDGNNVERPGEMAEIGKTLLEALSPRGRIRRWRKHADRLNVAGDLLDAAEALMDEQGTVENMDRFDALLAQAEMSIERAQNEALDIYGKVGRQAREQRRKANIRWAEHGEVIDAVKALATHAEYRGDEPRELWPHLFAKLDQMHLNPEEEGRGTEKAYKYKGGTISYAAFRKAVERARN